MSAAVFSAVLLALLLVCADAQPFGGTWSATDYGPCNACGAETQIRIVLCSMTGSVVPNSNCDPATKPSHQRLCPPVDCSPVVDQDLFGFCRQCQQTSTQQCIQRLGNNSLVTVPLSLCNLTSATITRICPSQCQPQWVAYAYNCCDANAALGMRCHDNFSDSYVTTEACRFYQVSLNLVVPKPAACIPCVLADGATRHIGSASPTPVPISSKEDNEVGTRHATDSNTGTLSSHPGMSTRLPASRPDTNMTEGPEPDPGSGVEAELGKQSAASTSRQSFWLLCLALCFLLWTAGL